MDYLSGIKLDKQLIIKIMGNLLYIIAVILIIIWAVGFIGYNSDGIIHALLVVAVVAVLMKLFLVRKRRRRFF